MGRGLTANLLEAPLSGVCEMMIPHNIIHIQHHLGQVGDTSHYLSFSFRYPRGFGYVRRNDRQVVAAHELMYRGEKRKSSGVLEKNFFKKMSISG